MHVFERELATAVEHEGRDAIVFALARRRSGAFAVGADPQRCQVAEVVSRYL